MAASRMNSSHRLCRKYKYFFYFFIIVLCVQLFLAYCFYSMNQSELDKLNKWKEHVDVHLQAFTKTEKGYRNSSDKFQMQNHANGRQEKDGDEGLPVPAKLPDIAPRVPHSYTTARPYKAKCNLTSREAVSAISRAKTEECKQQIADLSCASQKHEIYPTVLPRFCPLEALHKSGDYLGCFQDSKESRALEYNKEFPDTNSPQTCIDFCTMGGYSYAGLQYKVECWCGDAYGTHGTLDEIMCRSRCPGDFNHTCGGFYTQRIFSTGLPRKSKNEAEFVYDLTTVEKLVPARIVFVLTVTGRAVRQIRRLIRVLYMKQHYFYIHVDSRQDYLYRELLPLEDILPNVRLARTRFATIWGGASLLKAHLHFMEDLLSMTDWHWDYYINLSESDYPIKSVELLTAFLTKYNGFNFLKSHGSSTPRFIQKQGLDQTFFECENHLWRVGRRILPNGVRYDGGSDWISLHRDFCQYAVTASDELTIGLKKMYQYTLLPVESFFHTLLQNSRFCKTWVDNNFHLTNWKRKLGCKCQQKAIVDWCGCSPNDLKTQDFQRILSYSSKATYFARKFEPIVNQDILNKLDELMLNDKLQGMAGLNNYWQNDYHHQDKHVKVNDAALSHYHSIIRQCHKLFTSVNTKCALKVTSILEANVLYVSDHFQALLVKYQAKFPSSEVVHTVEVKVQKKHYYKVLNPKGSIGRLQNLEVGTDFDVKELIFRNYAGLIGPNSDVVLRHVWGPGPAVVVSLSWVDPRGKVVVYKDVTVPKESTIDMVNPKLPTPLLPGVWTVKIFYQFEVVAQTQFLVLPLATNKGHVISASEAILLHSGPEGASSLRNFSEFHNKIPDNDKHIRDEKLNLQKAAVINSEKTGVDLEEWIDGLVSQFWMVLNTCSVEELDAACPEMDICSQTTWSSESPDPKSKIKGLDSENNIIP